MLYIHFANCTVLCILCCIAIKLVLACQRDDCFAVSFFISFYDDHVFDIHLCLTYIRSYYSYCNVTSASFSKAHVETKGKDGINARLSRSHCTLKLMKITH